ncbi:hypothetical protein GQ42DRAFT_71645 [Ramicandelaber brevisporus]|nr:hypothetical protein GQ42DRAFT_71645 [Ramicandelaber brevisporus]
MTICCELLATAREACTGLSGDRVSQLRSLTAVRSWLESSLPTSFQLELAAAYGPSLSLAPECDDLAARLYALTHLPEFMDSILGLVASDDAEMAAAATNVFALYSAHCGNTMFSLIWTNEAVIALGSIVTSGPSHPAFSHAVISLSGLCTSGYVSLLLNDTGLLEFAVNLLEEDSGSGAVGATVSGQLLMFLAQAMIANNGAVHIEVHCSRVEQLFLAALMSVDDKGSDPNRSVAVVGALHGLFKLHSVGLSTALSQPEVLQRIIELERQHVHRASELLIIGIIDYPPDVQRVILESGFIERLITAAVNDSSTVGNTRHCHILDNLQRLVKSHADSRATFASLDGVSLALQTFSSTAAPHVVRAACLFVTATHLKKSGSSLTADEAESVYKALVEFMSTFTASTPSVSRWRFVSSQVMEAAWMLVECSSRFRTLFATDSFCHEWVAQVRATLSLSSSSLPSSLSSSSSACLPRLAGLAHLLVAYIHGARAHSLMPFIRSMMDIVSETLVELVSHPCANVASHSILAWVKLYDDAYVVHNNTVCSLPLDMLFKLISQPPESPMHVYTTMMAMYILSFVVEMLPAEQCRILLGTTIKWSLEYVPSHALHDPLYAAGRLLMSLLQILGSETDTVTAQFSQVVAAIASGDVKRERHAVVLLHFLVTNTWLKNPAFPSVFSDKLLSLPTGSQGIPDNAVQAVVNYVRTRRDDLPALIVSMDFLGILVDYDPTALKVLLCADIIGAATSILEDATHLRLRCIALDLLRSICNVTKYVDIPAPVRRTIYQTVHKQILNQHAKLPSDLVTMESIYAYCGEIIGRCLAGCNDSDDGVSLILGFIERIRSPISDSELAVCIRFLTLFTSIYHPATVSAPLIALIPHLMELAASHGSVVVRYRALLLTVSLMSKFKADSLRSVLPSVLDKLPQGFAALASESPHFALESRSLLIQIFSACVEQQQFSQYRLKLKACSKHAAKSLMDKWLWQFQKARHLLWRDMALMDPVSLKRLGLYNWMMDRFAEAIEHDINPVNSLSLNRLGRVLVMPGEFAASRCSAAIVSRFCRQSDLVVQNTCETVSILLRNNSSVSLPLVRAGLVDAISAMLDGDSDGKSSDNSNDSGSGSSSSGSDVVFTDYTVLRIIDMLMQLTTSYHSSRWPSPPSPQRIQTPLHVPVAAPIPVGAHEMRAHQQLVQQREAEIASFTSRVKQLINQAIRRLSPTAFQRNRIVPLWQLQHDNVLDEQLLSDIHSDFMASLGSTVHCDLNTVLRDFLYHICSNPSCAKCSTATFLAAPERMARLLDLMDASFPLAIRATSTKLVSRVVHGTLDRLTTAKLLLARYPSSYFSSIVLGGNSPSLILDPTVAILSSIGGVNSPPLDMRGDIATAINTFVKLLERHWSHPFLPFGVFDCILQFFKWLANGGWFNSRLLRCGIVKLLFKFAFDINSSYSCVACRTLSHLMKWISPFRTVAALEMANSLSLLSRSFGDLTGLDLVSGNNDFHQLLADYISYHYDPDSFLEAFLDSGILERILSKVLSPSSANSTNLACSVLQQIIQHDMIMNESGSAVISHLMTTINRGDRPLIMDAAVSLLRYNPLLWPFELYRSFFIVMVLSSINNDTVNPAKQFVECGGMDACRCVLRACTMRHVDRFSLVWMLDRFGVYAQDPADLALDDLSAYPLEVPDEMPAEYNC